MVGKPLVIVFFELFSFEQDYGFDVLGAGKEVDQGEAGGGVVVEAEEWEVTGEGGGFAGDVNY